LGFGAWLARASITEGMVTRASLELVKQTTQEDLERGRVYPALRHIRTISQHIATAVMEQAFDEGAATIERPPGSLFDYVAKHLWTPTYPIYTKQ
jgi:malate dehydrogenase (oxaloacetate-decarboxylating)(NADP+)